METVRSPRIRSAFTLIELVTVLVLLGIVAVFVGGPTLSYVDSMRLDAAAARLTSDIRFVQRLALGSSMGTWITFDAGAERYSLFMEDPSNPGKSGRVPTMLPLDLSTNTLQFGPGSFADVSIDSVDFNSTTELEFDSFGVPYDGNGVVLTATGRVVLSSKVAVQVHPVGGFVEAVPWP